MAYKQDKDACCCEYILPLFALVGCRWSRGGKPQIPSSRAKDACCCERLPLHDLCEPGRVACLCSQA